MDDKRPLLDLSPALDRSALRKEFSAHKRIQIRDFLTADAAARIARHLAEKTPWGLAWSTPQFGTHKLPADRVAGLGPEHIAAMMKQIGVAMSGDGFSFLYGQYLMHDAYVLGQEQDPLFGALVDELNGEPFLEFIREITQVPEIRWTDSQATLYGPGHFLALHQDIAAGEHRLVAYVINLCTVDWRPDWGGYLNFFDEHGNVVAGYRPIFNSLNMFSVPHDHNVGFVPGFAPIGRYAITGWFRSGDNEK